MSFGTLNGIPIMVIMIMLMMMIIIMWMQTCPLSELQGSDRESRKIIKENGGIHSLGLNELL